MPDQVVETQTTGLGGRLINSVVGVGIGALLFAGSFVVLYVNEGRFDLSGLAKAAPEVQAADAGAGNYAEQLVSVSGAISGSEAIGDGVYLKPASYIYLKRTSEIYAWVERTETKTQKNLGGSETKTTTYTYTRDWRETPESTSRFHDPEGHQNPDKTVPSQEFRVNSAVIGAHPLEMSGLGLPAGSEVQLTPENVIPVAGSSLSGVSYIYQGTGNLNAPATGDLRIKFSGLKAGTNVTVFGKLGAHGELGSYQNDKGERLYRVFEGSRADAVATLKSEFTILTWVLRGVGFAMMWIGMMMFLGPIEVILDIVPFVGGLARGLSGMVAFPVSLALTAVTIVVSKILHNPVAVAVSAVVLLGVAAFLFKKKHQQPGQAEQSSVKAA
jgi:hypothetical protein